MILGIDEVGRGPWAGPLVFGAVVLGCEIDGLTDSKALTKRRREELNGEILERAAGVGLGWVHAEELDTLGLASALRVACQRAVEALELAYKGGYSEIIIDGTINFLAETGKGPYVTTLKKADLLVPSVSAASIVAKVARDAYMAEQHEKFPGYGFKAHVGYGTAAHRAAIERRGVTPEHRLSFAPLAKYAKSSLRSGKVPRPLPSSPIPSGLPHRSLSSGPVARSAPSFEKSKILSKAGAAPPGATQAGDVPTTRAVGDASETVAAEELARRGHTIVERNWKTKYCEIDIVSTHGDTVYFTEVKHRKNARQGGGVAAITPKKLRQMEFAAKLYVQHQKLHDVNLRLLAISTIGDVPSVVDVIEI